jgi:hypothetical protein
LVYATLDGSVFSLHAATGKLRHAWRFDKRIASQPAVMGGRIFVGTLDGWLIGIDRRTVLSTAGACGEADRRTMELDFPRPRIV